jgi:hypothetical protein
MVGTTSREQETFGWLLHTLLFITEQQEQGE